MAGLAAACGRRDHRPTCRSCTAAPASDAFPSTTWAGFPATKARPRSASATPRSTSSNSTSTARSWTRSTRRDGSASPRTTTRGRCRQVLMEFLESRWQEPDEGIWETRGARQHFTHSKMMAWVAADRAVKAVEQFGLDGPVVRLARPAGRRSTPRSANADGTPTEADVHAGLRSTRARRSTADDAARRVPAGDAIHASSAPSPRSNVSSAEDGFVHRYTQTDDSTDGLPPGEGAFLACTFWLADNYALAGRHDEARDHLRDVCWPCATTSGCSPRSTTSPPDARSATSRKRSRTSR